MAVQPKPIDTFNLRLQTGCVSLQVWLARQVLVLGPSRTYPLSHLKLTVLLYWNNQPMRAPFSGDPGSPQLLAETNQAGTMVASYANVLMARHTLLPHVREERVTSPKKVCAGGYDNSPGVGNR